MEQVRFAIVLKDSELWCRGDVMWQTVPKMTENEVEYPIIEPDEQKLLQLSAGVQKLFDIELLGIDVIIENATGRYAVIDVNVFPGYDGVQEFVPAMLELIQSKVAGRRGTAVKLEKTSAFYLPPICETVNGGHLELAVRPELQSKKAVFAEECLKLTNGLPASQALCSGGASYVEPFVGNGFKSYYTNDVSNGTA